MILYLSGYCLVVMIILLWFRCVIYKREMYGLIFDKNEMKLYDCLEETLDKMNFRQRKSLGRKSSILSSFYVCWLYKKYLLNRRRFKKIEQEFPVHVVNLNELQKGMEAKVNIMEHALWILIMTCIFMYSLIMRVC